jgi:hypothetical protein
MARSGPFSSVSARMMRRILVDHARARQYQKQGGHVARVTFEEGLVVSDEPALIWSRWTTCWSRSRN